MKPTIRTFRIPWLIASGLMPASLNADEILGHPTAAGFRTNNAGTAVIQGPYGPTSGRLFIGRSYYTEGTGLAHFVVPFQLPDLGQGVFSDVRVSFTTNTSPYDEGAPIARDMNLWALPNPRPYSAPTATDVYADGQNHTQRGILVHSHPTGFAG